ncbi:MAG: DnaJ domain-containing protein [Rhodospirillales bacterium]
MIVWFLIGAAALFVFMGGLRAFEKAKVKSIKSLLAWMLALGGLSLALLLIVTGRGGIAISALLLFGPLLWQQFKAGQGPGPQPNPFARQPPRDNGTMTAVEAYQVLGLKPGASDAEIKDAHRRLMMAAHPDHGGSDWLATRINQARDVLMG